MINKIKEKTGPVKEECYKIKLTNGKINVKKHKIEEQIKYCNLKIDVIKQ